LYAVLGGASAATIGPWLVLVLLGCGVAELVINTFGRDPKLGAQLWPVLATATTAATGGVLALVWVAFKVGALSYGGGFVIIPLMQGDAVHHYHWMTSTQFLDAVALGQVTPGPVVQTVAVVGYAAAGVAGGLLAALIAFAPSFTFVLIGAPRFDRLRNNERARAFLNGAGPAAIGAILGVAIPLALALAEAWQYAVLAFAFIALFPLRRSVVVTIVGAGIVGAVAAMLGASLP
jgi:chromate transporter